MTQCDDSDKLKAEKTVNFKFQNFHQRFYFLLKLKIFPCRAINFFFNLLESCCNLINNLYCHHISLSPGSQCDVYSLKEIKIDVSDSSVAE